MQARGAAPGAAGCLLKTDFFDVYLKEAVSGEHAIPAGRCTAWMVIRGEGEIKCGGGGLSVPLTAGETVLIPAGLTDSTLAVSTDMKYLAALLPE